MSTEAVVNAETLQYGIRLAGCPVRGPFSHEDEARYWIQRMRQIAPSAKLMVTSDGGQTWTEADH